MRKYLCALYLTAALIATIGLGGVAAFAQDDPPPMEQPAAPELPKEAVLKWAFNEGMTLHFTFNTHHAAISSIKGSTEGAVLRLVAALTHPDEQIQAKAAELLQKGGKKVLAVLQEYVAHDASAKERTALKPVIEYLEKHPEGTEEMPDRFIIAEREGRTTCSVDWAVTRVRGPRATVHVKTQQITVRAKQKTLGMQDYEHADFIQGVTRVIDPRTGTEVIAQEPDNPVAAMFFHAMNLDYFFTIDINARDLTWFKYTNENAEAERKAMGLSDPLQIAPSFRRLSGKNTKVGDKWEVVFEYFAGGDGTRIHICEYELAEIAMRMQRRCARMPWKERIYMRAQRAEFPGEIVGGGEGEFWMDIDNHCLVFHSQEIAFENRTTLRIPRKDQPQETRDLATFFHNVLKLEMRLHRVSEGNVHEGNEGR